MRDSVTTGPVSDATLSGVLSGDCSAIANETICSGAVTYGAPFTFTVSAPGYQSASRTDEIPAALPFDSSYCPVREYTVDLVPQ